jgi:hypothetical protein
MAHNSEESSMSDIFLSSGRINTDLDPQTIAPVRRATYAALREAQIACERAEADEKSANEAIAELVKAHDRALAALPRRTFLDEWRASRG